jgi:hypothetical protein
MCFVADTTDATNLLKLIITVQVGLDSLPGLFKHPEYGRCTSRVKFDAGILRPLTFHLLVNETERSVRDRYIILGI